MLHHKVIHPPYKNSQERLKRTAHTLAPLTALHILEKQLESIAQSPHIRIQRFLELERLRHDLDGPMLNLGVLAGFEAEEEVAGMFGVDAEIVDRSLRVGLGVGCQPSL